MLDEAKKVSSGKKRVSVDSMESDDNSMNLGLEARKKYLAERERQKEILRKEEEDRIETAKKEEEKKAEHERQENELGNQKKRIKLLRTLNCFLIIFPLLPVIVSLCTMPKYFFMYNLQGILLVLLGLFTVPFVSNCIKYKKELISIKEKIRGIFTGSALSYSASIIFFVVTIGMSINYKFNCFYDGYDNGYFYSDYEQDYASVFVDSAPILRIPSKLDGRTVRRIYLNGDESKVRRVYLPETFIFIETNQFFNFENLEFIDFSSKTTYIGNGAFCSCSSLSYFEIPGTVKNLGYSIFEKCYLLKTINFMGTVKQWNEIKKEEYAHRSYWSDYYTEYWYSGSSIEKVICLDGAITLEAE